MEEWRWSRLRGRDEGESEVVIQRCANLSRKLLVKIRSIEVKFQGHNL